MKHPPLTERSRNWLIGSLATVFFTAWLVTSNIGCGDSGGLSSFGAAPELPEFNDRGEYRPYYASGEMNIPRYFQEVILLETGLVLAAGGSDENGLSSIDTLELFDQSTLRRDEPIPASQTGTWFDTDFEGNPINLQQGRIYHTLTELPDDTILIVGGTQNLALAREVDVVEVFDPVTRTIEELDVKMFQARFRHATTTLPGGLVMITGGQFYLQFTQSEDINVQGGGNFGSGQVILQQQIDTFPSLKGNEVYSVAENEFTQLQILDTGRPAELTTRRGRSGHKIGRFAGPDGRNNTGDDLYLIVGGFMTLTGENAPTSKFPGVGGQTSLTSLEFYDPLVEVFTKVPAVTLIGPRINWPQVTNLGVFNQETLDGVSGMGNAILIANGDDDDPLPNRDTVPEDELYVATYTGFGPAQGLQFFRQISPNAGHYQPIEAETFTGIPEAAGGGRTNTNFVPIARRIEGGFVETGIYNLAGVALRATPLGQIIQFDGSIQTGVIFDPFFSLDAAIDFESSTRDLTIARLDPRNPLGIVGAWLLLDADIPTNTLDLFGTTPEFNWARVNVNHVWGKVSTVGGPDGVDGNFDDRILIVGGGTNVFAPGGDPSSPSTEVLVQPGQGSENQ